MNSLLLMVSINAQLASAIYTKLIYIEERLQRYIYTFGIYIKQLDFNFYIWSKNTRYDTARIEELPPIAEKRNKILEIPSFTTEDKVFYPIYSNI